MKYTEYSEVPLLLFLKIAKDDSKMHLLRGKKKASNKKVKKFWEHCKEKWDENHPSDEWVQRRTQYSKCTKLTTILKKLKFVLEYLISTDIVPSEEFFEKADLPYSKDLAKTVDLLTKRITKETNQLEIYNAQYKALIEGLSEQEAIEKDEVNIHEVISTLEMATGIGRKHSEITIGEYEGDQKGIERKNKALEAQNKSR